MDKNQVGTKLTKIAVIGEYCTDRFIYGSSHRLCPDAPAPVFVPDKMTENAGMAGNVFFNLVSLGAYTKLFANKNKVMKTRYIDDNSNHLFLRVDEGDDNIPEWKDPLSILDGYDAIVISDYNKGFLTEEKISQICDYHPLVFIDTKKIIGDFCRNAKYIKINHYEYEKSKLFMPKDLLNKLIITKGKNGAEHMGVTYPVKEVEVKDVVGSGDTFMACFAYSFVRFGDVSAAIIAGNEGASKVVTRRGVVTI